MSFKNGRKLISEIFRDVAVWINDVIQTPLVLHFVSYNLSRNILLQPVLFTMYIDKSKSGRVDVMDHGSRGENGGTK